MIEANDNPRAEVVIDVQILEVNRKANRLILSEKVALYEERREKRDELFSSLQVGQKVTGTVRSIAPFGVFIDLGGIDGLLHVTDISYKRVQHPSEVINIGDTVKVQIVRINRETQRISLGMKQLESDPWDGAMAKYAKTTVKGLHRLPDSLTLRQGALVEPLACVVQGVEDTRLQAGQRDGSKLWR